MCASTAGRLPLPLLLLLALLALCGVEAFSAPFTASRGYSVGKVAPLRESPPLNASSAADLDVIVAARAFAGELLFFQCVPSLWIWRCGQLVNSHALSIRFSQV